MFVLTLAVFHWGMHYRLSRYEASQNKSHPMAKMWLGDKSYVAAATVVLAEQGPALTIFMAFLGLFPDLKIRTFSKPGLRFLRRVVRPPLLDYGHALLFRPPPILACL